MFDYEELLERFLSIVELLSGFETLRKIPQNVSTRVKTDWGNQCAICGGKKSELGIKQLDTAHIVSVEEGGESSEENLLPLCRRKKMNLAKAERNIDLVGCHQLLDNEGTWSREAIRGLKQAGPKGRSTVKRPQPRPSSSGFKGEKDQIEFLIAQRRTGLASKQLEERRKKYKDSPDETLELLIMQLRCERRRRTKNREQNIKKIQNELEALYKRELGKISRSKIERLNRIEYEIAMIHFAENDFKKASEWLRRYESHGHSTRGGWLISEVQACVADFEDMRKKSFPLKPVKKTIKRLEQVVPELDKLAFEDPQETIFNTWRVTTRLHLARMKAYIDDEKAMSLVEEAEKIRDKQDAETGWKSYTLVLLLHTKGESHRARGDYEKAIQVLSLAARKIIHDEYKNYEYLDNVLEGLLRVPKGCKECKNLDSVRGMMKNTREALYVRARLKMAS